jgi:hypothetical protein
MSGIAQVFRLERLHIDIARNSTDDFNPFHDPQRWHNIRGNPFGGPIALGFQLEFLVADLIARQRRADRLATADDPQLLPFGNYDFGFASALAAGEAFEVEVKKTLDKTTGGGGLSNRAVVRKRDGTLVLTGTQSSTAEPRFEAAAGFPAVPLLDTLPDRIPIPGTPYFHKRKYLNTSNGKNFCLACLVDQSDYFDELAEHVRFPALFTCALLSSALLEKARRERYDFEADPVVYTRHRISIDRRLQGMLRSNERLHLLVEGPLQSPHAKGLGRSAVTQRLYRCFGIVRGTRLLFRASVEVAPLHAMLAAAEDSAGAATANTSRRHSA